MPHVPTLTSGLTLLVNALNSIDHVRSRSFSKWRRWRRSFSGVSRLLGAILPWLSPCNLLFTTGCELSKDKRQYSWDSEDEELSKADIEQKLVLSQVRRVCLYHHVQSVMRLFERGKNILTRKIARV